MEMIATDFMALDINISDSNEVYGKQLLSNHYSVRTAQL